MPRVGEKSFSGNLALALRIQGMNLLGTENRRWQQALDVALEVAKGRGIKVGFDGIDRDIFAFNAEKSKVLYHDKDTNQYNLREYVKSRKDARERLKNRARRTAPDYLSSADVFIEIFRNPRGHWDQLSSVPPFFTPF